MSKEYSEQQKQLDALKDAIAGKEIVKWEDVKRKEGQHSNYDLPWLDKKSGTSLSKIDESTDLVVRQNKFLEDLDKQLQPGRNINEYRELKTFLIEQGQLIKDKVNLTQADLADKLEKLDDLIVETNVQRYEDASSRLSDDAGFEELEKMREAYHKTINTLAIETLVQEKLKITGSTTHLLDILHDKE